MLERLNLYLRETAKLDQRQRQLTGRHTHLAQTVLVWRDVQRALLEDDNAGEEIVTEPPEGEPLPTIFVKGRKPKERVGA